MINHVNEYALVFSLLHPRIQVFLSPYFSIDLKRVHVNVKLGRTSALGSSIWTIGRSVVVQRGKLNLKWVQWTVDRGDDKLWHKNNGAIDLATVQGMTILAHEIYHVQYWLTNPRWRTIAGWVVDLLRSWWFTRRIWSHAYSRFEQAAIQAVDKGEIGRLIRAREDELRAFEDLR